jgi:hypothetical protein
MNLPAPGQHFQPSSRGIARQRAFTEEIDTESNLRPIPGKKPIPVINKQKGMHMISNDELNAVAALDLTPIKMKLMHLESGEGWSLEQANAVEVEYRRFLFLMKKYPDEQTAPTVDVDTFWHYHILDTMKYAVDCQQAFGYFLHHYPYVGIGTESSEADQQRAGARMQELYEAHFGRREQPPQEAAWCGAAVSAAAAQEPGQPADAMATAWCGAAVSTAWCGAAVQAPVAKTANASGTAWCGAAVQAPVAKTANASGTAWCGAAVQAPVAKSAGASGTAWCGAAVQAPEAKLANASSTAWCGAAVQVPVAKTANASGTAWCGAAVQAPEAPTAHASHTAWCGAAVQAREAEKTAPDRAAQSAVTGGTAWCGAAVQAAAAKKPANTSTAWCGAAANDPNYGVTVQSAAMNTAWCGAATAKTA